MPKFHRYLERVNSITVEDPEGIRQLLALSRQVARSDLTREHREELFKIITDKIDCGFEVIRKKRAQSC